MAAIEVGMVWVENFTQRAQRLLELYSSRKERKECMAAIEVGMVWVIKEIC